MRSFAAIVFGLVVSAATIHSAFAEVIWTEGEKPLKSTMTRHPWYAGVKRDQLSGGDFISNWSKDTPGEAVYSVSAAKAGEYELWVRANPVGTRLSYKLNTGDWIPIDMEKNNGDVVNIAADGKVDLRFVCWASAGKVKLNKGANAITFRMHSENNNHGMLDCFVLADDPFKPRGILKPGEIDREAQRVAALEKGFVAFDPPADRFDASALMDLRFLNEKSAGDGGFIGVKGSQFIHGRTGQPLRFWAVNGPPHSLKGDDLRECARMLAKRGVNLVRIHGGLYDAAGVFKPEEVQHRLDVVRNMKQEGIYSHLSIYFPLWLDPKPGTPWLQGYDGQKHPFASLYFNPDFQKQYREWWKAMLLTPDARTGRKLIEEPALMSVELVNEDSYFFWTFAEANIPDPQLRIVETLFADWCRKKYGSPADALKAWRNLSSKRDNVAEGRLGMRPLWNMANEKTLRDQDTAAFLVEDQRQFYADTIAYLRSLGFKGLVTCSNWYTASPEILGPLERYSYNVGDFIDRHGYFGCDQKGDNSAWSVREGHTWSDRSALRFDGEKPGSPKSFGHPAMDSIFDNKPTMISETTFCRPNRYRSEAPLFYACYGALQDSGCIVHFALDSSRWAVKPGFFMQPWTLMAPSQVAQFPAAAMIYRQSLIETAQNVVELNLGIDDLKALKGTPMPQEAALDELRLKDVPKGMEIKPGNIIDPLVHLVGRTTVTFTKTTGPHKLTDTSKYIDRKNQTVTSLTQQLRLDYGMGVLTINAPAAQGVSGNLKEAGETKLRDLSISCDMDLAHIIAVSLDGKPLAQSAKILLQVMSEEKPAGWRADPAGTGTQKIVSLGRDPWMIKGMTGSVRFTRPDAAQMKVTALDGNGYKAKDIGSAAEIKLEEGTIYYVITR
ncbi:MAG: hypothetical protein ACHRHE_20255 [Tepidisphaerales bacterium]